MTSSNAIIFAVATLLSLVDRSVSINCFYCNSANNSACLDVTMYDPDIIANVIPIVHCERDIPDPINTQFFCRKVVQTIFHSHKQTEVRVTRGCGWIPHHQPCYRADSSDHLETACQCFTDYCNSSENMESTTATVLFLALAACLYFYR